MARSQLLKDLASGNDLESALFRLKIILSGLENEEINKWIDNEIEGYENIDELPLYRIVEGRAVGTYIIGSQYNGIKYTKSPIPINHIPEDIRQKLLEGYFTQGIPSLKSMILKGETIGKPVPPEVCHRLSSNGFLIGSMNIELASSEIETILSKVKNKLISIIIKLEKEFEDLDSLDIFHDDTSKEVIEETEQYIVNLLFDNSVTIGNNNKIKSSEIGHVSET